MDRLFFIVGSLFGLIGVTLGAMGAHLLKGHLDAHQLSVFEVGVRYQMYHAFALFAVAWAFTKWPGKGLVVSGWLFITGTILFSGALYIVSLSSLKWLGMVAPLGGLALITGWLCLAWSVWKK